MRAVNFVGRDLGWSEEMRQSVQHKIVAPLCSHLGAARFELSVHLNGREPNTLELWVVLQTFDGGGNQVVRCQGSDFHDLVAKVALQLQIRLKRSLKPGLVNLWVSYFSFLQPKSRQQIENKDQCFQL